MGGSFLGIPFLQTITQRCFLQTVVEALSRVSPRWRKKQIVENSLENNRKECVYEEREGFKPKASFKKLREERGTGQSHGLAIVYHSHHVLRLGHLEGSGKSF